jgi:hypothetical protein
MLNQAPMVAPSTNSSTMNAYQDYNMAKHAFSNNNQSNSAMMLQKMMQVPPPPPPLPTIFGAANNRVRNNPTLFQKEIQNLFGSKDFKHADKKKQRELLGDIIYEYVVFLVQE